MRQSKRANVGVTSLFAFLALVYFYVLLHFWNIGVGAAAAMLMAGRLPDLLFEIRTGEKIGRQNMPTGSRYFLSTALIWAALLILWQALCRGR